MKNFNLFNNFKSFFFKEQSPTPVALFRIFFGFFVLQVSLAEILPNFYCFFGQKALIDIATIARNWWQPTPVFDAFLLLPAGDIYRLAFFFVFLFFALCLTIGFQTRLSAIIVYLGLLTLDRQNPFILDGGDDFMRIMSFLLVFSAAGEAYSIDRMIKAKRAGCKLSELPPALVAPWAQRMIQIQISLIYLSTFLAKIIGPQWQNGTAVYYASQLVDFARLPLPWLTTNYFGYQFLNYYTLIAELAMGTLVWIKPLRYPILVMAALFHAGVDLTMNLPCFEWLFVCSYINFIAPPDLQKVLYRLQQMISRLLPIKSLSLLPDKKVLPIVQPEPPFILIFSSMAIILFIGAFWANPLRAKLVASENKRDYVLRLAKAERLLSDNWQEIAPMPDNNPQKLNTQEALALILSLKKDYAQAGRLLKDNCQKRIEQKKPYNPELIRAFSTLSNIYLETGHLDACELSYRTIWQYDKTHLPNSKNRLSTDLNNLAVLYYFRALLDKDKLSSGSHLNQADAFYVQALNNLHLCEVQANTASRLNEADILSNQYLCLREQCRFAEAKKVKQLASVLNYDPKKLRLP